MKQSIPFIIIIIIWYFLNKESLIWGFFTWSNNNQGFIAIAGFLLALFGIVLPINNSKREQEENQKMLFKLLLLELWQNMNFAYQLEVSYRNNKVSAGELAHIPKYPPRFYILEKIITPENLKIISKSKVIPEQLLEIYAQIKMIDKEFIIWVNIVMSNNFTSIIKEDDGSTYELASSKLLELVNILMRNSIWLWLEILRDEKLVKETKNNLLIDLSKKINNFIRNGRWINPTYKASFYKDLKNQPEDQKFDIILCWENDWIDSGKEIIELKNIIPLHETWKNP